MEGMEQGTVSGQDAIGTSGLTASANAAQGSGSNSTQAQSSDERVFRQSEVNEIVKKAKYGAVEDYKRLSSQQPNYAQQKYGESNDRGVNNQTQPSYQNTPPNYAQQPSLSTEEQIRKLASEEAQRLRDQWIQEANSKYEADNAKQIVESFWNKISTGREKYQDFDQVIGDIEYARFPNTVQLLAQHVENAGDVMYDLGKDRFKMLQLEQLAQLSPRDAIIQAQRLSKSLQDNEAASKVRLPNEPLSKLRPSNTGTDNGVMSVKDYRQKYRV